MQFSPTTFDTMQAELQPAPTLNCDYADRTSAPFPELYARFYKLCTTVIAMTQNTQDLNIMWIRS